MKPGFRHAPYHPLSPGVVAKRTIDNTTSTQQSNDNPRGAEQYGGELGLFFIIFIPAVFIVGGFLYHVRDKI